ncbi:expressed unknown protein [Seminavis robusta]|uniref:Uncharacterized protein n=1 Tax=Seminavis robusta TaxID=568900 RepID=A0A9N8D5R6_9STRA|nr:expressed unknown protein [Seminavis robusta]|eukprot:Sro12_g009260.1 n/a (639) ;mRNA; f:74083-75999
MVDYGELIQNSLLVLMGKSTRAEPSQHGDDQKEDAKTERTESNNSFSSSDSSSIMDPFSGEEATPKESGKMIYVDPTIDTQEAIHQAVKTALSSSISNLAGTANESTLDSDAVEQMIRQEIQKQLHQLKLQQQQPDMNSSKHGSEEVSRPPKSRESRRQSRKHSSKSSEKSDKRELPPRRHTTTNKASSSNKRKCSASKELPPRRHTDSSKLNNTSSSSLRASFALESSSDLFKDLKPDLDTSTHHPPKSGRRRSSANNGHSPSTSKQADESPNKSPAKYNQLGSRLFQKALDESFSNINDAMGMSSSRYSDRHKMPTIETSGATASRKSTRQRSADLDASFCLDASFSHQRVLDLEASLSCLDSTDHRRRKTNLDASTRREGVLKTAAPRGRVPTKDEEKGSSDTRGNNGEHRSNSQGRKKGARSKSRGRRTGNKPRRQSSQEEEGEGENMDESKRERRGARSKSATARSRARRARGRSLETKQHPVQHGESPRGSQHRVTAGATCGSRTRRLSLEDRRRHRHSSSRHTVTSSIYEGSSSHPPQIIGSFDRSQSTLSTLSGSLHCESDHTSSSVAAFNRESSKRASKDSSALLNSSSHSILSGRKPKGIKTKNSDVRERRQADRILSEAFQGMPTLH